MASVADTKGKHQEQRQAQRHGHQGGYVVWAGRKVKIQRPRVRTVDGQEVPLRNYQGLQQQDLLDEAAFERMLYGVASHHYETVNPALPEDLAAYGAAKSTVSARFAQATGELLQQFLQPPVTTRMRVLYLDALVLGSQAILVSLDVDAEGRRRGLPARLRLTAGGPTRSESVHTSPFTIMSGCIKPSDMPQRRPGTPRMRAAGGALTGLSRNHPI